MKQIVDNNGTVYDVIKKMGEGAFGTVWKVSESGTCRIYAIKIMEVRSQRALESVQEEIKALQKFTGDCRVTPCIKKWWRTEDASEKYRYYLLIDFIDGKDLLDAGIPKCNLNAWHKIFKLLVMALHYIHSFGVVHRDIKPQNILITQDYHVYYVDFGLSCIAIGKECPAGGTIPYMPPEFRVIRASDPESGSVLSDIYSLGVTMYEAMSREPYLLPGMGNIGYEKEYEQAHQKARLFLTVSRDGRNMTPWNKIILQMISYNRLERPTTKMILTELRRFQEGKSRFSPAQIRAANEKYRRPGDERRPISD